MYIIPLFLNSIIQLINKTTFVLSLALSLSSIPFYGFDYLVTGPLGFVSQDVVFKNTIFDQTRIKDFPGIGLLSSAESSYKYVDIDVSPFDRGEYLAAPELDVQQALSFEDLNYRGEFEWTTRNDKVSGISDSRSGFFTLSKVFKKQKKNQPELSSQSKLNETRELNTLISEKREGLDVNSLDLNSEITKRFVDWYDLIDQEINNQEKSQPYSQLYNVSFPSDYLRTESLIEKDIEQKIKNKYYSNPVYKTLLNLDVDFFLKRQPQKFKTSAEEEVDLYSKRRMIESYYDSLRDYSNLPYNKTFEEFFDGTKSFSNKVYNHQFKGTLRSVRRLFSLTLDPESEKTTNIQRILKFDQPLYEFSDKPKFSPYHEELTDQSSDKNKLVSGFLSSQSQAFFNKPLYAGWDENLRKFVITNKFLPRTLAGYKVNIDNETRRAFSQDFTNKKLQKICIFSCVKTTHIQP